MRNLKWNTRREFRFLFSSESFLVCFGLAALKCSLVFCYTSTDFEVHRNWKSITRHLPLAEWYFDQTSEWTLDYPPFFAYFECLLGWLANKVDPQIVTLQATPFMNLNTLLFQRFSVIVCDYAGCMILAESAVESIENLERRPRERLKFCLFCFLALNPALILLDNIHFQYNSMMYGLLFVATSLIIRGNLLQGALVYSVLLNFKHIYLYYAPAFVGFYLTHLLLPINKEMIRRGLQLALAVGVPLMAAFGPFIHKGGLEGLQQIVARLFPFKRGLTHSYWAPNFWALYNSVDYFLYKLLRLQNMDLPTPKYMSGVVQVYSHVVLPNVNPLTTHCLVLAGLCLQILLFSTKRANKFLVASILSSFIFFLCSWHVHEKALLLIYFPFTVLVYKELRLIPIYLLLSMCTIVAQFPLIFEVPTEELVKYSLAVFYLVFQCTVFKFLYNLPFKAMMPRLNRLFMVAFAALELYKLLLHRVIFGTSASFLPLMATSVLTSVGVHLVFVQFLFYIFGKSIRLRLAQQLYRWREARVKSADKVTTRLSDVKFVAGVDISTYNKFDQSLAVCSLTVCCYPDLKIVYSKDETCLLNYDYLPDYLGLRELEPIKAIATLSLADFPTDLLLVDANGRFHKRGCGLASQVGYLVGIPSIGIAKNFGSSGLKFLNVNDEIGDQIRNIIKDECRQSDSSYDTAFELCYDNQPFLIVYKSASSSLPVYLSPGFCLNWEESLEIARSTMVGRACHPIRISDRRSRVLCKKWLDEACQRLD